MFLQRLISTPKKKGKWGRGVLKEEKEILKESEVIVVHSLKKYRKLTNSFLKVHKRIIQLFKCEIMSYHEWMKIKSVEFEKKTKVKILQRKTTHKPYLT